MDNLEKEISELLRMISTRKKYNIKRYKSSFSKYEEYIEKSIYLLMSLYLLLSDHMKKFENTIDDINTKNLTKLSPFSFVLINIINSCIVIHSTIKSGYSTQAKILLRNYIEISDAYLCYLADDKFSNFLTTPIKLDEGDNYIHVKYDFVLKTLKSVMHNLNFPKKFCNEMIVKKDKIYKELSGSMHGKYISNILDAFNVIGEDRLKLNILGNIGNESELVSRNFVVQSYLFLDILIHVLIKTYELPFINFGLNGIKFATEYKTIRDSFYLDILLHIIQVDKD
ncbi:MAG: hypothetical protein IAE93_09080 [Ignavibacteria bacterium]|nr:hypothetical protein [Ignavibacteria bacterium]